MKTTKYYLSSMDLVWVQSSCSLSAGGQQFNAVCVCLAFGYSDADIGIDADIDIDIDNDCAIVVDGGIVMDMIWNPIGSGIDINVKITKRN